MTEKTESSRLEALAAGKACYARLFSHCILKKREHVIVLGDRVCVYGGGGVLISASAVVPHHWGLEGHRGRRM